MERQKKMKEREIEEEEEEEVVPLSELQVKGEREEYNLCDTRSFFLMSVCKKEYDYKSDHSPAISLLFSRSNLFYPHNKAAHLQTSS